jgi:hypothetical protein
MYTVIRVLTVLLGLLTLIILGAEPSGTSEEALYAYQDSCDTYGLYILWGWALTAITLVSLLILTYIIENQKTKR